MDLQEYQRLVYEADKLKKPATDPRFLDPFGNNVSALGMLAMRMRWGQFGNRDGELPPVEHIDAHGSGDKVFVFIVHKGEAMLIEDDKDLYPSDQLITKLRLLK